MIINGVWGEYDSEEYECTVTFPNTYDEVKALMLEGKMIYLHIPEETNNDKTIPETIILITGTNIHTANGSPSMACQIMDVSDSLTYIYPNADTSNLELTFSFYE